MGKREGRREEEEEEEEEEGGAFAGSGEQRVCGCKGAVRGKDEGLSPLPPDRALRESVGTAWQGVACCPCPLIPKGTRTDPPSFGRSNATPALCLPAGARPEPDVRAAVAGSRQADGRQRRGETGGEPKGKSGSSPLNRVLGRL